MRNTTNRKIRSRKTSAPRTVTLTRAQIASIHHDMGWEPEDTTTFWRYARREDAEPGCLARKRAAYIRRVLQAQTPGAIRFTA